MNGIIKQIQTSLQKRPASTYKKAKLAKVILRSMQECPILKDER